MSIHPAKKKKYIVKKKFKQRSFPNGSPYENGLIRDSEPDFSERFQFANRRRKIGLAHLSRGLSPFVLTNGARRLARCTHRQEEICSAALLCSAEPGPQAAMEKGGKADGGRPEYSIIVPTYNERLNVALIVYLIFKHLP
jgi:hypothetical protein